MIKQYFNIGSILYLNYVKVMLTLAIFQYRGVSSLKKSTITIIPLFIILLLFCIYKATIHDTNHDTKKVLQLV